MILRAVIAGAILLVLGAALFFVPIPGQGITSFSDQSTGSYVAGSNVPATFYEPSITPAAITFSVSWAYSVPVNVSVYSCGTDTSCAAGTAYAVPSQLVAQGDSAVGTLTFNGVAGDGYEVYASSIISVNIAYNGPLVGGAVGLFFLIIGAIALVAGAAIPAGGLRPPTAVKDSVLRRAGRNTPMVLERELGRGPGGAPPVESATGIARPSGGPGRQSVLDPRIPRPARTRRGRTRDDRCRDGSAGPEGSYRCTPNVHARG